MGHRTSSASFLCVPAFAFLCLISPACLPPLPTHYCAHTLCASAFLPLPLPQKEGLISSALRHSVPAAALSSSWRGKRWAASCCHHLTPLPRTSTSLSSRRRCCLCLPALFSLPLLLYTTSPLATRSCLLPACTLCLPLWFMCSSCHRGSAHICPPSAFLRAHSHTSCTASPQALSRATRARARVPAAWFLCLTSRATRHRQARHGRPRACLRRSRSFA